MGNLIRIEMPFLMSIKVNRQHKHYTHNSER